MIKAVEGEAVEGEKQGLGSLRVSVNILRSLNRFWVWHNRVRSTHEEYFSRAVSAYRIYLLKVFADDPTYKPPDFGSSLTLKARYHAFVASSLQGQRKDDVGGGTKEQHMQLAQELQREAAGIYQTSLTRGTHSEGLVIERLREDLDDLETHLGLL
jgi:hypothetical protein